MKKPGEVRLGIIGVGGMGGVHARLVRDGGIDRCVLGAVADTSEAAIEALGGEGAGYADGEELIRSGAVDAVLIATPHYSHTSLGIVALKAGLHVLVEKPISVHKADCERLIAAHVDEQQVFAAMFNQRTDPHYRNVKELIDEGGLGALIRVNWTVTNWFRTQHYYDRGEWKATWKGEGGGVLLNQSPHQLDLLQWLCGMPVRVHGFCGFGKHHEIEVEDEVTAYLEYENGATGVFITSTGEAPGTNRLEIVGESGKIVVEDGEVWLTRNAVSSAEFCRTVAESFAEPETTSERISAEGTGGQHAEILENFVAAILDEAPLIAPAAEGIRSVELANSILYSSMIEAPVDLPLDGAAYERRLQKLIADSTFVKRVVEADGPDDLSNSFNVV